MNPIGPALRGQMSGEDTIPDMGVGAELKHNLSANYEGSGAKGVTEVVKGMDPEERYVII